MATLPFQIVWELWDMIHQGSTLDAYRTQNKKLHESYTEMYARYLALLEETKKKE